MKLAYLINQYPMVSQSFIRREIAAIEAMGMPVARFSLRAWSEQLVDALDQQEQAKTRYVLAESAIALGWFTLRVALTRPLKFFKALKLTIQVGWDSDRGLLMHLTYLVEACVLLGWWQTEAIDHVHVHFGTNSATVAMLCREMGGPAYSLTVHGPEEFDKPMRLGLAEKIERAAFVVAVSSFSKSQLCRWCSHQHWSKIHVVRCGVDDLFLTHPYTPVPAEPRFVCVARLAEQKGHLLLVEAASRLAAAGWQFKLILVGDGELRGEIERLIARSHLENHIEILGWATNVEVRQQILAAQAMVMPSFAEGLPVVFMEALALHRPVISTYIAGIPELVETGRSGWLVPAGSIEALAAAMQTVLETPVEQLVAMGKMGAAQVAANHNAQIEAGRLLNLIKEAQIKSD